MTDKEKRAECRKQGLVMDPETKQCREKISRAGMQRGRNYGTSSALSNNNKQGRHTQLHKHTHGEVDASYSQKLCKFGPKIMYTDGKKRCPKSWKDSTQTFKARYCRSGHYGLELAGKPMYIVNPSAAGGARGRRCIKNPAISGRGRSDKISRAKVLHGTAPSTRGFTQVDGRINSEDHLLHGLTAKALERNPKTGRIVSKKRRAAYAKLPANHKMKVRAAKISQWAKECRDEGLVLHIPSMTKGVNTAVCVEGKKKNAPKKNTNGMKVPNLKRLAKNRGIKGYSKMKKANLVSALFG